MLTGKSNTQKFIILGHVAFRFLSLKSSRKSFPGDCLKEMKQFTFNSNKLAKWKCNTPHTLMSSLKERSNLF